ncbi:hypothetical protein BLNAU_15242 [Blattamonas nauphoetae]|uniref:Uncharacterized protein n=1 Tax=Blattamonas nauphoetae TaxID=2049346 RepID=A0ABQ9XET8_9EUKA|nr:hypothetical protein BLNAU_15242 [Blattamonas nauphoetae]
MDRHNPRQNQYLLTVHTKEMDIQLSIAKTVSDILGRDTSKESHLGGNFTMSSTNSADQHLSQAASESSLPWLSAASEQDLNLFQLWEKATGSQGFFKREVKLCKAEPVFSYVPRMTIRPSSSKLIKVLQVLPEKPVTNVGTGSTLSQQILSLSHQSFSALTSDAYSRYARTYQLLSSNKLKRTMKQPLTATIKTNQNRSPMHESFFSFHPSFDIPSTSTTHPLPFTLVSHFSPSPFLVFQAALDFATLPSLFHSFLHQPQTSKGYCRCPHPINCFFLTSNLSFVRKFVCCCDVLIAACVDKVSSLSNDFLSAVIARQTEEKEKERQKREERTVQRNRKRRVTQRKKKDEERQAEVKMMETKVRIVVDSSSSLSDSSDVKEIGSGSNSFVSSSTPSSSDNDVTFSLYPRRTIQKTPKRQQLQQTTPVIPTHSPATAEPRLFGGQGKEDSSADSLFDSPFSPETVSSTWSGEDEDSKWTQLPRRTIDIATVPRLSATPTLPHFNPPLSILPLGKLKVVKAKGRQRAGKGRRRRRRLGRKVEEKESEEMEWWSEADENDVKKEENETLMAIQATIIEDTSDEADSSRNDDSKSSMFFDTTDDEQEEVSSGERVARGVSIVQSVVDRMNEHSLVLPVPSVRQLSLIPPSLAHLLSPPHRSTTPHPSLPASPPHPPSAPSLPPSSPHPPPKSHSPAMIISSSSSPSLSANPSNRSSELLSRLQKWMGLLKHALILFELRLFTKDVLIAFLTATLPFVLAEKDNPDKSLTWTDLYDDCQALAFAMNTLMMQRWHWFLKNDQNT